MNDNNRGKQVASESRPATKETNKGGTKPPQLQRNNTTTKHQPTRATTRYNAQQANSNIQSPKHAGYNPATNQTTNASHEVGETSG
jgi:hypothetical protein